MIGAWFHLGIPTDLSVQVCVKIDKSRGHKLASSIYCLVGCLLREIANTCDVTVVNCYIRFLGFRASTVDNRASGNYQ